MTTPGISIDILYAQYSGGSWLSLMWDEGNSTLTNGVPLPWSCVTPFMPGQPLEVSLTVNKVPAVYACPAQTLTTTSIVSSLFPNVEPRSVVTNQGNCAYVFSSFLTPTMTAFTSVPFLKGAQQQINVSGSLLGSTSSSLSASFGSSGSNSINGSIASYTPLASPGSANVTITLPPLPAGSWPLMLTSTGESLEALFILMTKSPSAH